MKFSIENQKDIGKYFLGTYVKFMGMRGVFTDGTDCAPAEELVHTVDNVNNGQIKGKRYENGESIPYTFFLYSEEDAPAPEVEFILPKKSYFNTDTGAYLLQRIPARQYRRGVCSENTSIASLNSNGGFTPCGVPMHLMDSYIRKPQFYTFAQRDVSYAVSRRMAVSVAGKLFVDMQDIGSINYETGTIHAFPLFHPEIEQVLKDRGQSNIKIAPPVGAVAKKRKGKDYLPNLEKENV